MVGVIGFIKHLVADGYKLVGWSAPALSILFTLAKWQEWSVLIDLKEISYAWSFAPITIWFFIAYVRRWLKSRSLEQERDRLRILKNYENALDILSEKFDHGNNNILNANLKNDQEYGAWKEKWRVWSADVEIYLEEEFGLREKNMFRNLVIVQTPDLGGINKDHEFDRRQVAQQLETIRAIIIRYSDLVQKWRAENI